MQLSCATVDMVSTASQGGFSGRIRIVVGSAARRASAVLCALVLGVLGGVGCGHHATQDECEAIFKRSAEIALSEKKVFDAEEVKRQVEIARSTEGDALIKDCLGKRITEDALACSQKADSHQALEACLE